MSNMTVNTTNSAASNMSVNSGNSAVSTLTGGGALGEQDFLNLLTTKLQNQDPTQPTDNTQMIAELAQFASLSGINNLSSASQQEQGVSLIGHTVSGTAIQNNQQVDITGTVTGVAYGSGGVQLIVQTGTGSNATSTYVNLANVSDVQ